MNKMQIWVKHKIKMCNVYNNKWPDNVSAFVMNILKFQ